MALSKEAFIEAAWDIVGRKVSKERLLADIYETARTYPVAVADRQRAGDEGRGAIWTGSLCGSD